MDLHSILQIMAALNAGEEHALISTTHWLKEEGRICLSTGSHTGLAIPLLYEYIKRHSPLWPSHTCMA